MRIKEIYEAFSNLLKEAPASMHINGMHMVAEDNHAVNVLKDKQKVQVLIVMPHREFEGDPDHSKAMHTIMVFAVEKDKSGQRSAEELVQYQKTEDVINWILESIAEKQSNGCCVWSSFEPKSVVIHPEYRQFGGWNGWSTTFSF